jgi:hypothetical protein
VWSLFQVHTHPPTHPPTHTYTHTHTHTCVLASSLPLHLFLYLIR